MFDLAALTSAVARHGRVARVVIAAHDGSSPRETGAAMLVWEGGQEGTIGGGALEWEATTRARSLLAQGGTRLDRRALGPSLGQCCGGAVTVLTEVYDPATLPQPQVHRRPLRRRPPLPLAVARLLDKARAQGLRPGPVLLQGWFLEPLAQPTRQLWIWGASHVGRALVGTIAPLPAVRITWVDVAPDRFPEALPDTVTPLPLPDPAQAVPQAPPTAEHLILTYSHALDLELCHRLLTHGFAACGLIGSATKWARFRSRLAALGHGPETIARITCPIGDPALGKHPQAIAIGVAAAFLAAPASTRAIQSL
ncbi:MAG: xanthine dehydrogenase accessory protein XdhC [Exiguobacterium profundum]|nr:MAG: xanthine dehydrogenase accessory protein XdhC [Exiguobacterium profundum]